MEAPPPSKDSSPVSAAAIALRFEDVTQDGRLLLEALPQALESTLWRQIGNDASMGACRDRGILPILTRLVLEAAAGPFSALVPVHAEARYRLARAGGHIMLDVWATVSAPLGRTYAPVEDVGPPAAEAPRAVAGRIFAEHTLTRPFAPAGQRRVSTLDFAGAPEVAGERPASDLEAIGRLPPDARPLEPAPRADPQAVTFGIMHTDSNMHVNSLAYLRVFEEAALRRFVVLGHGAKRLGRHVEIGYVRPCFAGEQVRVVLQAFEDGGRLGATGIIVGEAAPTVSPPPRCSAGPVPAATGSVTDGADPPRVGRPRVYVRMTFEP